MIMISFRVEGKIWWD